jgi:hypothetical protein
MVTFQFPMSFMQQLKRVFPPLNPEQLESSVIEHAARGHVKIVGQYLAANRVVLDARELLDLLDSRELTLAAQMTQLRGILQAAVDREDVYAEWQRLVWEYERKAASPQWTNESGNGLVVQS